MTTPLRTRLHRARSTAAHAFAWSVGRTADHMSRLGDRLSDAAGRTGGGSAGVRRAVARCCDGSGNALILLSELVLREPRSGWQALPHPRRTGEALVVEDRCPRCQRSWTR